MNMKVEFRYLMTDTDRHGTDRLYVRKGGRKIRIREVLGTPEFALAYSAALDALALPADAKERPARQIAPAGTLGWLAAQYFRSPEFGAIADKSQQARRSTIEACLREPRKADAKGDLMGLCPLAKLGPAHVVMLQDRKGKKHGAARNRHKHLSALFTWGIFKGHLKSNPARDVRAPKKQTDGFYTWTDEDVAKFEESHPVGTKARLALALMLYTGMRRGDVVQIGRQHIRGGNLVFTPSKTKKLRPEASVKPILPELASIIDASPTGDMNFLVTDYGKPFTSAGFGGRFRKWCDTAGLPQCTAHGLRKAGATRAAEAGATDRQLMALFDWTSAAQATTYTAKADKARLAAEAIRHLGEKLPHPGAAVPPKNRALG